MTNALAYDNYRRFIQKYSDVVLGIDQIAFEEIIEDYKDEREILFDADLSAEDWKAYHRAVQGHGGKMSWMSPSRKILKSSSGGRSAPSFHHG